MTRYRRHGRTPISCEVKIEHDKLGEVVAETKDVSETGLFVKCRTLASKTSVGDALIAKLCRENQWDHPSMYRVVRLTEEGLGLTFS